MSGGPSKRRAWRVAPRDDPSSKHRAGTDDRLKTFGLTPSFVPVQARVQRQSFLSIDAEGLPLRDAFAPLLGALFDGSRDCLRSPDQSPDGYFSRGVSAVFDFERYGLRAGKGCKVGQLQRLLPMSVVSHSFRLIWGRVIISWNGLEA